MCYVKNWQMFLCVLSLILCSVGALGQTNTVSSSTSNSVTPYVQEVSTAKLEEQERELSGFFIIGMVINILVIVVFVIWAAGEWRKSNQRNLAKK